MVRRQNHRDREAENRVKGWGLGNEEVCIVFLCISVMNSPQEGSG